MTGVAETKYMTDFLYKRKRNKRLTTEEFLDKTRTSVETNVKPMKTTNEKVSGRNCI